MADLAEGFMFSGIMAYQAVRMATKMEKHLLRRCTMSRKMLAGILLATVLMATQAAWAQPPAGTVVPGSFICLVDDFEDAFTIGQAAVRATSGTLGHVYSHALKGFSIQVPPGIVIANLRAHPGILHVEPDIVMRTCATLVPTGIDRIDAEGVLNAGIDCSGIGIAIIDTGIDVDHPDLDVVGGRRFYTKYWFAPPLEDGNYDDDNGHGTHVAGIAAANGGIVGVAPGAGLYAVKVLNSKGSGYMSDIIAGIDWVTENANKVNPPIRVANMSLGGPGPYEPLQAAIEGSLSAGVSYVVAAGNESDDVEGYVPAAYGGIGNTSAAVYTISAFVDTDGKPGGLGAGTSFGADDSFASFSNFSAGDQIAYIMPGVNIYSTYKGGGYAKMSGTSMATPHFAGLLALAFADGDFGVWSQTSTYGLTHGGDPDSNLEELAHANYSLDGATPPDEGGTLLASISTSASTRVNAKKWKATVTIKVVDGDGVSVSGATVYGTWSTATVSALTDSSGTCSFTSTFSTTVPSVTFTVTNVTKAGYTYISGPVTSAPISKP